MTRVPVLHILTSDAVIARPDFLPTATALLHTIGSRGALHLRTRLLSGAAYRTLAAHLLIESQAAGALLVINDRVDIALTAGVSAVHLGRDSLRPSDVRQIAPSLSVGLSIHTEQEAREAGPVSWLLAGHVFDTASHPDIPGRGLDFLQTVVAAAHAPVIAVGGLHPAHATPLRQAGVAGVAILSGIWDERTPKDLAIHYLSYLW